MILNKASIQREVELTIKNKKYTEELGRIILLFADVSVYKRGIKYRYNEFEVEFIIKPRIVDMLLLKVWKYKKKSASAYTYFSMVTSTAIIDAVKDIRRAEKGDSTDVFYIEDIMKELKHLGISEVYHTQDVYLENNEIKLK